MDYTVLLEYYVLLPIILVILAAVLVKNPSLLITAVLGKSPIQMNSTTLPYQPLTWLIATSI